MKSGNLNFPEPSGPLQACNGTAKKKDFRGLNQSSRVVQTCFPCRSVVREQCSAPHSPYYSRDYKHPTLGSKRWRIDSLKTTWISNYHKNDNNDIHHDIQLRHTNPQVQLIHIRYRRLVAARRPHSPPHVRGHRQRYTPHPQ